MVAYKVAKAAITFPYSFVFSFPPDCIHLDLVFEMK